MTYTMTDLFAGAGGSSSGAEQVPGIKVRIAANHWKLAVETHNTNLPHADHDCADISQVDPRRYPATDFLWASPECTNHSQARGKRKDDGAQPDLFGDVLPNEAAERSRATMWDVPRFVEAMYLRGKPYKGFVVENVVDARDWLFFDAWVAALTAAGYCLHHVYMNSAFAQAGGNPAPQSRDRYYCVGHLKTIRCPNLSKWTRPAAWCSNCETTVKAVQAWKRPDRHRGRYNQQYVWKCPTPRCHETVQPGILPAAAAIDWSLPGQRIGDRDKPLAAKTLRRIEAGLKKFARPIHLEAAGNTYERPGSGYVRAWPVDTEPFKTLHTTASKGVAVPPLMVPVEGREGKDASSAFALMRTQTARNETGVLVPPFIAELRGGYSIAREVTDPLATVTANGNHHGLVVPPGGFIMRNNGSKGDGGEHCTGLADVMRTLTTAGHQSLVQWGSFLYDFNGPARSLGEPMPTQTTRDGNALCSVEIDVNDCLFRMLEPHEAAAAMAFAPGYIFLGNKREKVRLAGNAVTPPAARDLIGALVEAVSGDESLIEQLRGVTLAA